MEMRLGQEPTQVTALRYHLLHIILDKLQTSINQSIGSYKLDSYHNRSHWTKVDGMDEY